MCKCKKAMQYEIVLSWCEGDEIEPAFWSVCLYATCTRCGDDNGRQPIDDVTVEDIEGDETATEVDVQLAMTRLLPKGITMDEVKVTE